MLFRSEKSLRPIAVGKPFILVSTPGSLEYLKSYGFETFSPWINENYDTIVDPVERLNAIAGEMQRLNNLEPNEYCTLLENCHAIAVRNKQRFFSTSFFNDVVQEYKENMIAAVNECKQDLSWGNYRSWADQQPSQPNIDQNCKILNLM